MKATKATEACPTSGWAVRRGATDGQGHIECPVCKRVVPVQAHRVDRVVLIEGHRR